MRRAVGVLLSLCFAGCAGAPEATEAPGRAPSTAPVRPAARDELVVRQVEFDVAAPRDRLFPAFLGAPLRTFIRGHGKLPGVVRTEALTDARFPAPGSVRLVVLDDGSTAEEEVLVNEAGRLQYLVSGYTAEVAAPIRYGLGEFVFEPRGAATHVRWTYSFALREDRFPGSFGCLGRTLFKKTFLDRDYADFMDAVAREIQAFGASLG